MANKIIAIMLALMLLTIMPLALAEDTNVDTTTIDVNTIAHFPIICQSNPLPWKKRKITTKKLKISPIVNPPQNGIFNMEINNQ